MAITIAGRPTYLYNDGLERGGVRFSNWNSCFNPALYIFNVENEEDILSRVEVIIYEVGSNTILHKLELSPPNRIGAWMVDISPFVKRYTSSSLPDISSSFINTEDLFCSVRFYIELTQTTQDNNTFFSSDINNPIISVNSAMQFGNIGGGNMARYVPYNTNVPDRKKMLFLTKFKTPVKFADYPLTLSFIFSDGIKGLAINATNNYLDINKNLKAAVYRPLDRSKVGKVNLYKLPENIYNEKYLNLYFNLGDPVEDFYVDTGYVDTGYHDVL